MPKKWIAFFVLLIAVLLTCSCQPGAPPASDSGTATEPPTSASVSTEEPPKGADTVTLASNGTTGYRIINALNSVSANYTVRSFAEDFRKKTGATLPVYSGSEPESELEILIGEVGTRKECRELYDSTTWSQYGIRTVGKKILIYTYSENYLEKELTVLLEAITKDSNGAYVIPAGYAYEKDVSATKVQMPKLQTAGSLVGCNESGEGNYEVTFGNVTAAEHQAYLSALLAEGFAEYATNDIAGNQFGWYLKGNTQAYVAYYPSKSSFKLVYGSKGYLPQLSAGSTEQLCTPTVTQLGRKGADESSPNGAPGMSYVFQLSDGRYIMVDGGPGNTEDEDALLQYLQEHKPQTHEKPVIAAWFITHAHGDHLQLAVNFITRYHDAVEIQMAAYNFPDFNTAKITHEDPTYMRTLSDTFKRLLHVYYKNAPHLILHTGQSFWIGDAAVEVLYTPEDYAPTVFPWGNHTSCAFRIRLGGKSVMLLGDCEQDICQFMADVYGETLKSDMLQLSHHGYNGACLDLYRYIDPDICFWASDEYRFLNDKRCLGTAGGYDFNAWIRNDSIKKRAHYHSSSTTIVPLT